MIVTILQVEGFNPQFFNLLHTIQWFDLQSPPRNKSLVSSYKKVYTLTLLLTKHVFR
jgi:hypothetical protein